MQYYLYLIVYNNCNILMICIHSNVNLTGTK